MSKKVLTGIKPTGMPHIGNYFGAIKPALELAQQYDARYFIADYHALNTIHDPLEMKAMVFEVAASWLACGLDPKRVIFYRQSDVPETFELTTALMAFTSKGLMNRAHAYKAKAAANTEAGEDVDSGVNMGLFTYPVLMAADILLFDTELVPVGKDQVQHVEMAADIAEAVNRAYNQPLLVVPKASVGAETQTVVGLDGRKMSKSYGNTIPLFCEEKELKKMIMKIVSDSTPVEEPKDPDASSVFALYKLYASAEQREDFAKRLRAGGMGWGAAKTELFELMNQHLTPIRERYREVMADRAAMDRILVEGGRQAREIAAATLERIRKATGIA